MLAQMHSECKYECQQWKAEREAECSQWENNNRLWDQKCPTTPAYSQFMQVVEQHGLVQTVLEPNRVNSILDLVFCSNALSVTDVQVGPSFGQSDHPAVEFQLLSVRPETGHMGGNVQYV